MVKPILWSNSICKQGSSKRRITNFYAVLINEARNEFIEDGKETLGIFLKECHDDALKTTEFKMSYDLCLAKSKKEYDNYLKNNGIANSSYIYIGSAKGMAGIQKNEVLFAIDGYMNNVNWNGIDEIIRKRNLVIKVIG